MNIFGMLPPTLKYFWRSVAHCIRYPDGSRAPQTQHVATSVEHGQPDRYEGVEGLKGVKGASGIGATGQSSTVEHAHRHTNKAGSCRYCNVAIKSELTTACSPAHNGSNKKEINSCLYGENFILMLLSSPSMDFYLCLITSF